MIGTARKPMEEILQALDGYDKITVMGCNGCAKACKTGGEAEVDDMVKALNGAGKSVV
jgi:hypothetical protein